MKALIAATALLMVSAAAFAQSPCPAGTCQLSSVKALFNPDPGHGATGDTAWWSCQDGTPYGASMNFSSFSQVQNIISILNSAFALKQCVSAEGPGAYSWQNRGVGVQ